MKCYGFTHDTNVKATGLAWLIIDPYTYGMIDYRDWFRSATGRRITAEEIGEILGLSRPSVTRRLTSPGGLSADEVIAVSRASNVNPVEALVDMGHLEAAEAMAFLDSDGQLVETADEGELALELARRLNPATRANEIDELAARRSNTPAPVSDPAANHDDGTVRDFDWDIPHAADSSPDENEERLKRGEDPID